VHHARHVEHRRVVHRAPPRHVVHHAPVHHRHHR
jgi:hypothetical protein